MQTPTFDLWPEAIIQTVEFTFPQSCNFLWLHSDSRGSLCIYKRSEKFFVILSLYVDDILLAGNDKEYLLSIKEWLSSNFEMKDMGEAEFILNVKIQRDRSKRLLSLSQESYVEKVLERFNMSTCKPIDTPVAKGEHLKVCSLTPEEKQKMTRIPYASAVGSLIYVMICTRPDIAYVVGLVSRY